jgi:hypothetical protein
MLSLFLNLITKDALTNPEKRKWGALGLVDQSLK